MVFLNNKDQLIARLFRCCSLRLRCFGEGSFLLVFGQAHAGMRDEVWGMRYEDGLF